jgi:BASS family bile acid:Na+ symporter
MTVGFLVSVIVPVCVTILMYGIGLNLSLAALRTTLAAPRNLLIATLLQIILLPTLAVILIALLDPPAVVALALLAVAVSPGGALSNTFTLLAGGNLAFSVVLTTLSTLAVWATAPVAIAAALASGVLEEGAAASLDPLKVAFDLVRLALVPIGLGLLTVQVVPRAAAALRRAANIASAVLIAVVVGASAIVSLPALHHAPPGLLVYAVLFSLGSLAIGTLASRALPASDRSACVIEFGLRNLPIAIVLTGREPTVELVAFLFCYFLANTAALIVLALVVRGRSVSVAPGRRGRAGEALRR